MNSIPRLISPSEGEILFLEKSIGGWRPDRICHLGLARTFQVVRPFPEMTVYENVKAAAVFGKPGARAAAAVDQEIREILDSTGLSPKALQKSSALNLPDRKRLEMARTLATQPRLLLLDEVLAGLNPREVEEAIPLILSLNSQRKISLLRHDRPHGGLDHGRGHPGTGQPLPPPGRFSGAF
jgi:branched-chain amino acid transport system ATP-binding protein